MELWPRPELPGGGQHGDGCVLSQQARGTGVSEGEHGEVVDMEDREEGMGRNEELQDVLGST